MAVRQPVALTLLPASGSMHAGSNSCGTGSRRCLTVRCSCGTRSARCAGARTLAAEKDTMHAAEGQLVLFDPGLDAWYEYGSARAEWPGSCVLCRGQSPGASAWHATGRATCPRWQAIEAAVRRTVDPPAAVAVCGCRPCATEASSLSWPCATRASAHAARGDGRGLVSNRCTLLSVWRPRGAAARAAPPLGHWVCGLARRGGSAALCWACHRAGARERRPCRGGGGGVGHIC
jgi:hypothetical protein